jgi:hypothetical protein
VNGADVKQKPKEPLVKIMENLEWRGNVKKEAGPQLNGPDFASGELAEAYSGIWVGNVMEADGSQVNGPTIG